MLRVGGDPLRYERELDGSHAGRKSNSNTSARSGVRSPRPCRLRTRTHAHCNATQHLIGLQGCNIYALISDSTKHILLQAITQV